MMLVGAGILMLALLAANGLASPAKLSRVGLVCSVSTAYFPCREEKIVRKAGCTDSWGGVA